MTTRPETATDTAQDAPTSEAPAFVLHSAFGLTLLLDPSSLVDRTVLKSGKWEQQQLALMDRATRAMSTTERGAFLDIGAYWGLYGILAHRAGARDVHIFEPDRRNFSQLQSQLFLNRLTGKVSVHPFAVSRNDGVVTFRDSETIPDGNRAGTSVVHAAFKDAYQVRCRSLDTMFEWTERRVVIKLDIEGHEPSALRGMKTFIARNEVFIQVEIFPVHRTQTLAAAEEVGLRLVKKIEVDHYFVRADAPDPEWLNG